MAMKVEYVSRNKQFKVTFEGSSEKDLFAQVAHFQEVFENNSVCGNKNCNSTNVAFNVRVVDDNPYYEKVCQDCKSKFQYGQNKKGDTLFPRFDKGWHKWTPDNDNSEEEAPKRVTGSKK